MKTIAIVDTAICTDNLGDEIIMDAVNSVVTEMFPDAAILRVPSHEGLSRRTHGFIEQASLCFIGGTNLLSSTIRKRGQWRLTPHDARAYGTTHTVCLGIGWSDYEPKPVARTRRMLHSALSHRFNHSVRDTYTYTRVTDVGLPVTMTSCPTTWALTPAHCRTIPHKRAPAAVVTISAWRPDPASDRAMVEAVRKHYRKVYFFPQMIGDHDYFSKFGWDDIEVAASTTAAYTSFLQNEDVDFIGTRLHGGIRALQKKRRALIVAIDNRATEIGRDIGLPVIARAEVDKIENWIQAEAATVLALPQAAIDQWKAQFTAENLESLARPEPDFRYVAVSAGLRRAGAIRRHVKDGLGGLVRG